MKQPKKYNDNSKLCTRKKRINKHQEWESLDKGPRGETNEIKCLRTRQGDESPSYPYP